MRGVVRGGDRGDLGVGLGCRGRNDVFGLSVVRGLVVGGDRLGLCGSCSGLRGRRLVGLDVLSPGVAVPPAQLCGAGRIGVPAFRRFAHCGSLSRVISKPSVWSGSLVA